MLISYIRLVPLIVAAAVLSPPVVASSVAQTAAPSHKHYDTPADAPPAAPGAPLAPRLQNLGVHTFKVSTADARAQLFMNQGLNLTYGFNHAEAGRAFAEAARLDPNLAMAYWGQALVLGPNINAAMDAAAEPKALALIQKAMALRDRAPARERAYIEALSARYTGKADDRSAADRAYASAMKKLTATFPDDLDARTLHAESLMDLRPWGYWTRDGQPYDETREIQSELRQVIAKHDTHPGALHLWIHLWESVDPKRAEAEADRLVPLMPGAGHMVHMPAHIYQRVGRHADVIRVNQLAARADEDYIAQCRAQGLYPLAYYPHNLHFIWMGASASGQKTLAIESARKLAGAVPAEALKGAPILQGFLVVPYYAMVRFGEWDQILADPGPAHATPFTRGVYTYARAMALIAKKRVDEAERALEELRVLAADPSITGQTTFSSNTGRSIMRIAPEVVAGEIAAARQQWDRAVQYFDRAIRYEDALVYQEPPDWHVPVRQNLAAALIAADRANEAETVLWEDLKRNPDHVWNLSLLSKALTAQNNAADAAMIDARLARARKGSGASAGDVRLANGVRLHYAQQGPKTGPAIILLHGYSDSSGSFGRVMPLMSPHLRVIAPDLRGHGDSDRPDSGYRIDDLAGDVVQMMDALNVPSAVIVGHSMSTFVARRVYEIAPERVTRLVLLGGAVIAGNKGMLELQAAVNALADPVDEGFVREFQLSTVSVPVPADFMNAAIANSRRMPAPVWRAIIQGLIDFTPSPARPPVPTLVLGGSHDAIFSVDEQTELSRAYPNAQLHLVDGVGHALHWEQPEVFVSALKRFGL